MQRYAFVSMIALTVLSGAWSARALEEPEPLSRELFTNDDVVRMIGAGFSDELILLKMKHADCVFSSGVDELLALKEVGASDEIIRTIIVRSEDAAKQLSNQVMVEVQGLRSPEQHQYEESRRRLSQLKPADKVAAILADRFISDTSDVVRARVCEVLGLLGDDNVLNAVLEKLNDRVPAVRHQAALAVSRLANAKTYDKLKDMLTDPATLHRDGTAFALGYMRERRAVPLLMELLENRNESSENRGAAAYALGRLGDRSEEVYNTLMQTVVEDHVAEVRGNAARALCTLAVGGDAKELQQVMLAVNKAYDRYPANRVDIVESVSMIRDGRAVRLLIDGLQDGNNSEVRRAAWEKLRQMTGDNLAMDYQEWQAWYDIKGRMMFPVAQVEEKKPEVPEVISIDSRRKMPGTGAGTGEPK
jgi:HEAT repeat protein